MGQKIPVSHRCLTAWYMPPFLPTPLPFPLMSLDFMFCYFKETNPELYTSQIPWASLPGATRHGLAIHIYGEDCQAVMHLSFDPGWTITPWVRGEGWYRDRRWISERQGEVTLSPVSHRWRRNNAVASLPLSMPISQARNTKSQSQD